MTVKLLQYQTAHVEKLVSIIKTNNACLDASDTGTGKTYTAVAACKKLGLRPFIICPKSVMANWRRVCEEFELDYITVVNYETIRLGKTYVSGSYGREDSSYVKMVDISKDKSIWGEKIRFEFTLDSDAIFIFDEAHKCCDIDSLNTNVLLSSTLTNLPIMLLSATIADVPEKFKIFTYVLKFIRDASERQLTFRQYMKVIDNWIFRSLRPMTAIHHMLYPDRAARIRIDVLGDLFPETQIDAIPYSMGKSKQDQIEQQYEVIGRELRLLKSKDKKVRANALVKILRAHQRIELLKVPTFVELAKDFMTDGHSIVIFVNFTKTLELLADMLGTKCLVYGEQTAEERDKHVQDFQNNKQRVIICNIRAGGVGLSFHDLHGGHPRVSLISPTWSAVDLTQALGRIHRAGGKSKSLQRIIFTAGTVEERISTKLKIKLKDLNSINNGDLDLTNINFINT